MPRSLQLLLRIAILFLPLACLGWGQGGNALIVNDGAGGLTTDVVNNLTSKLVAAGYTVTAATSVPGSLSTYSQIWDVRYNNTTPLTGPDSSAYLAFLSAGGSLFLMGENTGFATRNNSIISFISSAGGGTVTVTNPTNTQTVLAPFTGPNAVTSVTFLAGAGATTLGRGAAITQDASSRSIAIVFGPGNLTNATSGTLIVVFDVNFLQAGATAPLQALSSNLVAYLAAPTPVGNSAPPATVPTLSEWAMIALACGLALMAYRALALRSKPMDSAQL